MPPPELGPSSTTELVAAAGDLARRRFVDLLKVAAAFSLPAAATFALAVFAINQVADTSEVAGGTLLVAVLLVITAFIVAIIAMPLGLASSFLFLAAERLGYHRTWRESVSTATKRTASVVWSAILSFIVMLGVQIVIGIVTIPLRIGSVGSILLINLVAQFLLVFAAFAHLSLAPVIVVLEGLPGGKAVERSYKLFNKHVWHALGSVGLVLLGLMMGGGFVSTVLVKVLEPLGTLGSILMIIYFAVVQIGAFSFGCAVVTLLYLDLRVRAEGATGEELAVQLALEKPRIFREGAAYPPPPVYAPPPAQPSYAPPAQPSYAPPAQPSYAPPAQPSYQPPPQPTYQPPPAYVPPAAPQAPPPRPAPPAAGDDKGWRPPRI